jgi:hypothetical protein
MDNGTLVFVLVIWLPLSLFFGNIAVKEYEFCEHTSRTDGNLVGDSYKQITGKDGGTGYEFDYNYVVDGKSYAGHGMATSAPSSDQPLDVYYNSASPQDSRLQKGDWLTWTGIAAVFVLPTVIIIVVLIKRGLGGN